MLADGSPDCPNKEWKRITVTRHRYVTENVGSISQIQSSSPIIECYSSMHEIKLDSSTIDDWKRNCYILSLHAPTMAHKIWSSKMYSLGCSWRIPSPANLDSETKISLHIMLVNACTCIYNVRVMNGERNNNHSDPDNKETTTWLGIMLRTGRGRICEAGVILHNDEMHKDTGKI